MPKKIVKAIQPNGGGSCGETVPQSIPEMTHWGHKLSTYYNPLEKSVSVSARSEAFDDDLCNTKNDFADKIISPHTFRLYR